MYLTIAGNKAHPLYPMVHQTNAQKINFSRNVKQPSSKSSILAQQHARPKMVSFPFSSCSIVLITKSPHLPSRVRVLLGSSTRFSLTCASAKIARCPSGARNSPKFYLLDLSMPNAAAIFRDLQRESPDRPIVLLARRKLESLGLELLLAGAAACIDAQCELFRLPRYLRTIAAGGTPLSPRIAHQLIRYARTHHYAIDERARLFGLSNRESEVLKHLADGLLYKEIAFQMGITYQTVCSFIKRIYQKLNVRSRAEAVLKLRQHGS
jgi:DNA-binding NarL/FixJ family response regulator